MQGTFPFVFSMISTQITWLVVWLLASHLVTMVRARDIALRETHQAFLKEREEKARQSQVATNELKALFAAIHANAQVLLSGHCGVLSDQVLDVALRIASRSQRLALEIQDMLQLIQLDSPSQIVQAPTRVELCGLVQRIVTQMEPEAQARHISITVQFDEQPLPVGGIADQIEMLLLHLATNAVIYSFDGGVVEISGCREPDGMMHLTIRDHGLGIQAEKIPRIFDDYYRTGEAVRHCRESTGLGLAIVRRIAVSHRIRVGVTSQPGQGTLFDLFFPAFEAASEVAGTSHI